MAETVTGVEFKKRIARLQAEAGIIFEFAQPHGGGATGTQRLRLGW